MLGNIIFNLRMRWIRQQGERYRREQRIRKAYAEYWPEKKQKKTSTVMLVVIVIAIVGYFLADYTLQSKIGIEISPTLTTCWFSFWGVEIAALTGIKVTKICKGNNSNCVPQNDNNAVG